MGKREMVVENVVINDDSDVFTIAELGHNHQGDIEKCKAMFRAAKECGADAVKLQKRDNRALFTRDVRRAPINSENAYAPTYGAHREKLEFSKEQYLELQGLCEGARHPVLLDRVRPPLRRSAREIDMPAYKIASGDLTNTPLLKHVARFGKPMIISTGGATMDDVQRAYDAIMPINDQTLHPAVHVGLSVAVRGAEPPGHRDFRKAFPDVVIGFSAMTPASRCRWSATCSARACSRSTSR